MEVAGPLGTPLGLAQRKRASPRGEAGTSGFLSVSDSDRRVPAELGQAVAQLCPILCNPMDFSPPGSSFHGISQARILDWVVISSSRGDLPNQTSNLHLLHWQGEFFPSKPPEKPIIPCRELLNRHKSRLRGASAT